jgi:hypothetical protein
MEQSMFYVVAFIAYSETNEKARSTTKSVPFGRSFVEITPFPKHSEES